MFIFSIFNKAYHIIYQYDLIKLWGWFDFETYIFNKILKNDLYYND